MSSSPLDKLKDMFSDASENVSKSYSSFTEDKSTSYYIYVGLLLVIIIISMFIIAWKC